jgi:hypothetical protein
VAARDGADSLTDIKAGLSVAAFIAARSNNNLIGEARANGRA